MSADVAYIWQSTMQHIFTMIGFGFGFGGATEITPLAPTMERLDVISRRIQISHHVSCGFFFF